MPIVDTPVAPPSPKPPEPTPVVVEPTPVPTPEPTPAPAPAEPAKPETRAERMERIAASLKPKAEPAPEPKKPEVTKPATPPADPESDDAIKAEIEETTKGWKDEGQKKAFTKKTYDLRDAKRKLKELETKTADAAKTHGDLTTQLEAARKQTPSPANTEEIDSLKKQIEVASKRAEEAEKASASKEQELSVAAVERSAEYQNVITKPLSAIETRAKELAKKYELSETAVLRALHGSPEDRDEVAGAMKDADKIDFLYDSKEVKQLASKAEVLRTNAREALEKIEQKRVGESEAQTKKRQTDYAVAHDINLKTIREQVPILVSATGDDAATTTWNSTLEQATKFAAEVDFATLDTPSQSKLVLRGSMYPLMAGALGSYQKQNAELRTQLEAKDAEITALRGSTPPGDLGTREDGPKPEPVEKDPIKRLENKFAKVLGR